MTSPLLAGLHENLWASLRHTFNTDRVLLGVAYLVNFAAFLLLLALLDNELGQYFGSDQATYFAARYRLWLILQPCLMLFAIVVALAIKYAI